MRDQRGMLARPDLIRLLCVPWRHKKPQRRACIDSRMLSTTVASPCQTLRELLAGDCGYAPARPINGTAHAQFAEGLHFSAFHCYLW